MINAERSDFQNLLENVQRLSVKADDVLGKADKLLDENGPAITDTLNNVDSSRRRSPTIPPASTPRLPGVADLGQTIGAAGQSGCRCLSDDVDKLVKAVDADKVHGIVDKQSFEAFSATLANNKGHIDSLLSDTAALAKKLNETAGQLDGALGDVRGLAKAMDHRQDVVPDIVDVI